MSEARALRAAAVTVPAELGGRSWRGLLLGATRVEFRGEVIEPSEDSVLMGHGRCVVTGCELGGELGASWPRRREYLCAAHYKAWYKAGQPGPEWLEGFRAPEIREPDECAAAGCPRATTYGGDLCSGHRSRWFRQAAGADFDRWAARAPAIKVRDVTCLVDTCGFPGVAGMDLCDFHAGHARVRDKAAEQYVVFDRDRRLGLRRHFDLRPLPSLMRMEVQLVLQLRHDENLTGLPRGIGPVFEWLAASGVESLMDRDAEWWLERAESSPGWDRPRRMFVAYALRVLHVFRDDASEIEEWDRDVWRVERLRLDRDLVERCRINTISFVGVEPDWLRAAFKRWSKWRLQLGQASPSTVHQTVGAIKVFSDFLREHGIVLAGSQEVSRAHLERYLAYIKATDFSISYKHALISAVRHFLDEMALLGWLELQRDARFYRREIPQRRSTTPRFIEEHVMRQLETEEAIARIDDLTSRTLIMMLMETGLRGKDARFLPPDPVRRGNDGQPYLTFFNHKANREAIIPISDQLAAQIEVQQAYLHDSYPPTCRWLLPALGRNPKGERAYTAGLINKKLGRWLESLALRDERGNPVTVSAHQFRHTVGTRMVNDDVPLDAVQRFLDHSSLEMTLVYARMHDATLRKHVQRYHQRINRAGELVEQQDDVLADAAWMKERLARAKQALPNGYCGRPLVQGCPHPNACLTCDHFLTDASFLPVHHEQLTRTDDMIAKAEENGWERMLENSHRDRLSLVAIIEGLENLEDQVGDTYAA